MMRAEDVNVSRRWAVLGRLRRGAQWLGALLPQLLALAVAALAVAPALRVAGIVATRAAGDSPFLLQRVHQMAAAISAGHLPPRWMPDAAYGLGYPFWNYYGPLAYFVAGGIVVLGGGYVGAIKVSGLVAYLAAAAGAYRLARETWGSRAAGLLGSAAYTLAPYHLVNLYVRGDALSELASYALYPWVLVAVDRAVSRRSAGAAAGLALAWALLLVSHNISALLFAPVAAAYAAWRLWPTGVRRRAGTGGGPDPRVAHPGAGLAAPGIPEAEPLYPSVQAPPPAPLRAPAASPAPFGRHRMWARPAAWAWAGIWGFERRLWRRRPRGNAAAALAVAAGMCLGTVMAAWFILPAAFLERTAVHLGENTTGYFNYTNHFRGADLVDRSPVFDYEVRPDTGVPARVGLVQLALAALGTGFALGDPRRRRATLAFWVGVAVVTTFMMTRLSRPAWDHVPLLAFAQFPWRWLSVQALALALLTAPLAALGGRARGLADGLVAVAATAALGWAALAEVPAEALAVRDVTRTDLTTYEIFTGNPGSTVRAEYLPAGVEPRPVSAVDAIFGHEGSPRAVNAGGAMVTGTLIRREAARQDWQITAPSGSRTTVAFPTLWFPGWLATVNGGQPLPTTAAPGSGWLQVEIDPGACAATGQCAVSLSLERSDARALAEAASLLGALLWLALLLVDRRRRWGVPILAVAVALPLAVLGARSLPVGGEGGPMTLDTLRAPYPHANPDGVRYGAARLVNARLSTQGAASTGDDAEGHMITLSAGESMMVNLNWSDAPAGMQVTAALVSPAEPVFGVPDVLDTATQAPDAPEAIVLETVPEMATGLYFVRLGVVQAGRSVTPTSTEGADLGTVYLGPIRVRGRPGAVPPPAATVAAMGDVTLQEIQATPERVGSARWLKVRMVWRTERLLAVDYKTSVRLLDAGGSPVRDEGEQPVQEDKMPLYGYFPTTAWPAGESIVDRRWLPLPPAARPGDDYRVQVVLYDGASGQELGMGEIDGVTIRR